MAMSNSSRRPLPQQRLSYEPASNAEADGLENISLFCSESERDDEWDEFLRSLESAHHEQTSMWGRVKKACGGFQPVRFLAFRDGKLLGGCQVLHKKIRGIFHVGYICYGPQWVPMDERLAFWLNGQLIVFIRVLGVQYVYADFPYDGFRTAEQFHLMGFKPHPDFLPPLGRMTATVVLDLNLSEDELLKQMKATTRYNIRAGLKSGVVVKQHIENAPEIFTDLMWKLCQRRGCAPTPPERNFFVKVQEAFAQSRQVHFFFALLNDEIVSSLIAFTTGSWVRCWKVGWSGAHPKKYPNEVLWWEVIKWARKAGYAKFDFVWIERESAQALIAGHDLPDTPEKGIFRFKVGFGTKPVLLPLPASIAFNPVLESILYSRTFSTLLHHHKEMIRKVKSFKHNPLHP